MISAVGGVGESLGSTTYGCEASSLGFSRVTNCCFFFCMYGKGIAGTIAFGATCRGRLCWTALKELVVGAMMSRLLIDAVKMSLTRRTSPRFNNNHQTGHVSLGSLSLLDKAVEVANLRSNGPVKES